MRKLLFFLLILTLLSACKTRPQELNPVETEPVLEPVFELVSIIIIQADLINTQFEAVLKVTNPNRFALSLSSLKYQLYGNNLFWAEGRGSSILHVPANSERETTFRFTMNFIDMNRRLLDDIIAMRQVNYRFKGEAEIKPEVPHTPSFTMNFDIFGLSNVKPKAE